LIRDDCVMSSFFFFSSRRRHTRFSRDWSSDVCSSDLHTTNNRMELMAAIRGLEALKRPCKVRLTTDSQYLRQGITEWLPVWKRRGWRTADRKPVKNIDLWQRLEAAASRHEVEWHWVKGHSGHPENELVDRLANEAIDALQATT